MKKENKRTLKVRNGVSSPPNINPAVNSRERRKKKRIYSAGEYVDGIINGNTALLSQAITLIESSHPDHYALAQEVIEKSLPHSGCSVRVGITGVPGAGKSTFIETFGLHVAGKGRRVAVLTIDPSSENSGGSILGDKTRMKNLARHENVYIRPSPSAGSPGGVARKTRESIILCEAAGFDTIIVETVGVGQSETTVRSMVDFFLLLMLAGAGDELQGIKRGIIEMADALAVTKADGDNKLNAERAKTSLANTIHLFQPRPSGWDPRVVTCSALENTGIEELWEMVNEYMFFIRQSGYLEENRKRQSIVMMHDTIIENLYNAFYNDEEVKKARSVVEKQLNEGNITSFKAAVDLLDKYHKR